MLNKLLRSEHFWHRIFGKKMHRGISIADANALVLSARRDYQKMGKFTSIEKLVGEDKTDKKANVAYLWIFRKALSENDTPFVMKMYELIQFPRSTLMAAIDRDFANSKYLPDNLVEEDCAYTTLVRTIGQKEDDRTALAFLKSRVVMAVDGKSLVAALLAADTLDTIEDAWTFIPSPDLFVDEIALAVETNLRRIGPSR